MKPKILQATGLLMFFSLLLILPESCYRKFYKVADSTASSNIDSIVHAQSFKYLILRSGDRAFHMENLVQNSDKKSFSCKLSILGDDHKLYLMTDKKKAIPFSPSKQSAVLNEVHFYILSNDSLEYDSTYTIDYNKISKIEILEKDKARTTRSTIVSSVEIAFFAVTTVAAIAGASSSSSSSGGGGGGGGGSTSQGSCPYISVYDGNEFVTQGELYAGAVYPQLERDDYLQLSMQPVSAGKLELKISNDQQEIQNTDLAELMVITNDKNVQMHVDQDGKLYSISDPVAPVAATTNDKDILNDVVKEDDGLVYAYDDTSSGTHNNPVQLSFNKKTNADRAKLIINVRNGFWMDLVFNKMSEGYGTYYPEFVKQQQAKSADQLKSWHDMQDIPLTVSLHTNNGWQKLQDLVSVGPLAFREIIIPVDLKDIPGDKVQVKISAGFMFWELDYAAIDFSNDEPYTIEKLLPTKAVDEKGNDVTHLLTASDEQYLVQPVPGTLTTVDYAYNKTVPENKAQTFVLHSKGYYEYVRDFKNKPDVVFLQQFKNPGALSKYSMVLYKQVMNGDFSNIVKK